ncbi:MAG: 7TM-DISM domain-containing protein, partial [Mucilaginibacter sp.]
MSKFLLRFFLPVPFLLCFAIAAFAQHAVFISDTAKQQIFRYNQLYCLEDLHGTLNINDVKVLALTNKFKANPVATPTTVNPNTAYWYRFKISHNPQSRNNWIIEFFDQTIDSIAVYAPDKNNNYKATLLGSSRPFQARFYQHKNFTLN